MSLHMITTFETPDYSAWREVFETERDGLSHVGLSVAKLLRETDHPNRVWIVFEVTDRKRAEAWIEGDAIAGDERAGVSHQTHTFLETL